MLGTHLGRRVVPLATSTARRTRRPSDSSSSRRTSGSGTGRPNVRRASNNASLRRALAGRGLLTYTIGLAVPGNRRMQRPELALRRRPRHPGVRFMDRCHCCCSLTWVQPAGCASLTRKSNGDTTPRRVMSTIQSYGTRCARRSSTQRLCTRLYPRSIFSTGRGNRGFVMRATCKTLGVAARLSPPILRGEHPLFWISTACSGPEGPAASQETENEGIDVFSTERRDTGGCLTPVGHRNWMGVCRRRVGYVTRRRSWSAVSANMPNMQWHITFAAPRTRTWRPPNSSLRRPLTRSPAVRSL